jgi:hypothetical protein
MHVHSSEIQTDKEEEEDQVGGGGGGPGAPLHGVRQGGGAQAAAADMEEEMPRSTRRSTRPSCSWASPPALSTRLTPPRHQG